MSEAQLRAVRKGSAAGTESAQPREDQIQTALGLSVPKQKNFFMIRESREDGGKKHYIPGRLMHLHLDPGGFFVLTYLSGGQWVQVLTSPFDLEIATCDKGGIS